jgi:hypothetical protein
LMKSLRACWAVKRSCWTAAALLFDRPASRSRLRRSCFCSRRAVALWRCGAVALSRCGAGGGRIPPRCARR